MIFALAMSASGCQEDQVRRDQLQPIDRLAGLKSSVRVVVDRHGIPHLYAASRADAAFGLGWFHARDRFLQMDLSRRGGWGRLSELLGPAALEEDRFARLLGLPQAARRSWEALPAGSLERGVLSAYAAGVNRFLERASPGEMPEFYAQNRLAPEPWDPADSFAIHKKFTAELCHSFDDIMLQQVAEKLGREAAESLFPSERDARAPIVRHPVRADSITGLRRTAALEPPPLLPALEPAALDLLERFGGLPSRFGARASRGSNNWAIGGKLSSNHKPILCSDPHLGFSNPAVFYTAHLVSPGINVIGITVPGVPVIVFGHNEYIAWAGTNTQADVTDFYAETFDPKNPNRYLYRGKWFEAQQSDETIKVRGQPDEKLIIKRTRHGPLVTEKGKILAMQWAGERPSQELGAFLALNAARNLREFLDALRGYESPAQNFIYADVEGNIAIRPSGFIPRRARGQGRYPVDGAGGEYEWEGPVPFNLMPLSVNPPEGYLLSANQRPAPPDFPFYLGWEFDPAFRARRIDEVIASSSRFSDRSLARLQLDTVDICLRELVPLLIKAFHDEPPADPVARLALRILQGWDSTVRAESTEATIAWRWLERFADQVWEDEWEKASLPRAGNWGFCSNGWRPPLDLLVQLARESPRSKWFDDVRTPTIEDCPAIMRRGFLAAVAELAAEMGPGIASWRWDRHNQIVLPDLLRDPNRAIQGGPVSGNANTICPGGEGGAVTGGAVYRMVIPLGDLGAARGATPGIQAGVPAGARAEDLLKEQLQAYLEGSYLPLLFYGFPGAFPAKEIHQLYHLSPFSRS
ncbi:MAG: penicillin acylase family protein [Planctomycetes bacterium]|nr:penicillin acylase family protein [Planctomycetota bacterium]